MFKQVQKAVFSRRTGKKLMALAVILILAYSMTPHVLAIDTNEKFDPFSPIDADKVDQWKIPLSLEIEEVHVYARSATGDSALFIMSFVMQGDVLFDSTETDDSSAGIEKENEYDITTDDEATYSNVNVSILDFANYKTAWKNETAHDSQSWVNFHVNRSYLDEMDLESGLMYEDSFINPNSTILLLHGAMSTDNDKDGDELEYDKLKVNATYVGSDGTETSKQLFNSYVVSKQSIALHFHKLGNVTLVQVDNADIEGVSILDPEEDVKSTLLDGRHLTITYQDVAYAGGERTAERHNGMWMPVQGKSIDALFFDLGGGGDLFGSGGGMADIFQSQPSQPNNPFSQFGAGSAVDVPIFDTGADGGGSWMNSPQTIDGTTAFASGWENPDASISNQIGGQLPSGYTMDKYDVKSFNMKSTVSDDMSMQMFQPMESYSGMNSLEDSSNRDPQNIMGMAGSNYGIQNAMMGSSASPSGLFDSSGQLMPDADMSGMMSMRNPLLSGAALSEGGAFPMRLSPGSMFPGGMGGGMMSGGLGGLFSGDGSGMLSDNPFSMMTQLPKQINQFTQSIVIVVIVIAVVGIVITIVLVYWYFKKDQI